MELTACDVVMLITTATEWSGGAGAWQCCNEITGRRSGTSDCDTQRDLGSQHRR